MREDRTIISEQLFVGFGHRRLTGSPLVMMTPYGTDSTSKGRIHTISRSSNQNLVVDNTPQVGFRLRSTHGRGDEWSISDPRGFAVIVDASIALELINNSTVVQGEILEPCIWARRPNQNTLLNTLSEDYKWAVIQTQVANLKESWRNAKLGNRVTLTNGLQGVYLGKYYRVNFNTYQHLPQRFSIPSENSVYAILRDSHDKHWKSGVDKLLYFGGSMKLARIDGQDQISATHAEKWINQLLNDSTCSVYSNDTPFMVSQNAFDTLPVLTLEDHPTTDINCHDDYNHKMFVLMNNNQAGIVTTTKGRWAKGKYNMIIIDWPLMRDHGKLSFGKNPSHTQFDDTTLVKHVYRIKAQFTTNLGNVIERFI